MIFKNQIENYQCVNQQEENDQRVILEYINDHEDNILTRENKIAHLTSSGFIVNESLSKVLMIHHNIYNTWAWTGGHADGEEDLLKIAVTEAKEETGLEAIKVISKDIASIDILPVNGHIKRGEYVSAHLHLNVAYLLKANEKAPLVVNERETSGIKWIKINEVATHSKEPELIKIYNKLLDRL